MNWLLLVVGLIIIGFVVTGYIRGFIKSIFSLCSILVIIIVASFVSPLVDHYVEKNTQIYPTVEERCIAHYEQKVLDIANRQELNKPGAEEDAIATLEIKYNKIIQEKFKKEVYNQAGETGVFEKIGKATAKMIIESIIFLLTIILLWMIIHVVEGVLDLVAKLPVLNGINHLLGMVVGLFGGIVFIWALAFALSLCSTTQIGKELLQLVTSNNILNTIYEHNGIIFVWELFF